MKRHLHLLLLCSLLCMTGCKAVAPAPAPSPLKDWSITWTWSYSFLNYAICSSTVTTGCVNGFTLGYENGTTFVPLTTLTTTACTGTTQPEICTGTFNAQLPIGTITGAVEANYLNNAGVASESAVGLLAAPSTVAAGTPVVTTFTFQ
jgi:hypothetical protein